MDDEIKKAIDENGYKLRSKYNGDDGFIFISYPRKNKDIVMDFVTVLQGWGYRVWYDDIVLAVPWREALKKRIRQCSVFMAFVSDDYVKSEECEKEWNFASEHKKTIIPVHVKKWNMNENEFAERVEAVNAFEWYKLYDVDEFYRKLREVGEMSKCDTYEGATRLIRPNKITKPDTSDSGSDTAESILSENGIVQYIVEKMREFSFEKETFSVLAKFVDSLIQEGKLSNAQNPSEQGYLNDFIQNFEFHCYYNHYSTIGIDNLTGFLTQNYKNVAVTEAAVSYETVALKSSKRTAALVENSSKDEKQQEKKNDYASEIIKMLHEAHYELDGDTWDEINKACSSATEEIDVESVVTELEFNSLKRQGSDGGYKIDVSDVKKALSNLIPPKTDEKKPVYADDKTFFQDLKDRGIPVREVKDKSGKAVPDMIYISSLKKMMKDDERVEGIYISQSILLDSGSAKPQYSRKSGMMEYKDEPLPFSKLILTSERMILTEDLQSEFDITVQYALKDIVYMDYRRLKADSLYNEVMFEMTDGKCLAYYGLFVSKKRFDEFVDILKKHGVACA